MDCLVDKRIKEIFEEKNRDNAFDIVDWNDELDNLKLKTEKAIKDELSRGDRGDRGDNDIFDSIESNIHDSLYKLKTWKGIESIFLKELHDFVIKQLIICFESRLLLNSANPVNPGNTGQTRMKSLYGMIITNLQDMLVSGSNQVQLRQRILKILPEIIELDNANGNDIEFLREIANSID